MFLHHLTDTERKAFLTLAKEFILVDGVLDQEEEYLMEVMKREMNIEEGYPEDSVSRAELFKLFDSRKSKIAAIIEMQALGYANMEYHTKEKAFVNEMAANFGVSEEELENIDDWVVRQVAMLYEARELMGEEVLDE